MLKTLRIFFKDNAKDFLIITLVFFVFSTIVYGYFWFFSPFKLQLVYQNWDGPAYVVVAKSFYNPHLIEKANTIREPVTYFAAHLPFYPVFIKLFSFIGYFQSMIFVSQLFALLFILSVHQLVKTLLPKVNPLWIALSLILMTPRWFVVSHVGSSESTFLFLLTVSLIFLIKKKYPIAAIFGALAQLTRAQGILYFVGIIIYFFSSVYIVKSKTFKEALQESLPFLLIPMALIGVCTLYYFQYGDFLAMFHALQKYHHLQWPPFRVFSSEALYSSDKDVWQESIILNYLLYFGGVIFLFKQKIYHLAIISLIFFLPIPFVSHTDVSRYLLPLLPFTVIGYNKVLSEKTTFLIFLLFSPAIIHYAIHFMSVNISP